MYPQGNNNQGPNAQFYPQAQQSNPPSVQYSQPAMSPAVAPQREQKPHPPWYFFIVLFVIAVGGGIAYTFLKDDDSSSSGRTGPGGCQIVPPADSVYTPKGQLISVSFLGEGAIQYKDEIIQAVQFWNNVVSNDLQPIVFNHGVNTVDAGDGLLCSNGMSVEGLDVIAEVSSFADEEGFENVLGFAAPITLDISGKNRVRQAYMAFEISRFGEMVASARVEVMIHELGHALGIGSLWARLKLSDTVRNTYSGSNGADGFEQLGGSGPTVPIEAGAAEGTSGVHWSEDVFENELMTGILDPDVANPLSVMTIKSLEDLGYTVDVNEAQEYTMPGQGSFAASSLRAALRGGVATHKIDLSNDDVSTEKALGLLGARGFGGR